MKVVKQVLNKLSKRNYGGIDPSSLQFRLTIGVALVSLLGLGGLAAWTSWKMQRMIFDTHSGDLEAIIEHLPREIVDESPAASSNQMQTVVNQWSSSDLWLWVKQPGGEVIAQSPLFPDATIKRALMASTHLSVNPRIDAINGHYIVWCSTPLPMNNQLGYIYVARDVTQDYRMMLTITQSLVIGTLMAIATLTAISALFIWRSLHPLRQTAQMACGKAGTNQAVDPNQAPGEVRELVENWNRLLDQLSKTGEQQRQFTNGVSHELRTPLSVVYGYLQSILRRGTNLTPQQKEALQIAASETERTIQMLQDLLDLARAECGTVQFDLKPLPLDEIVAGVIGMTEECEQRSFQLEAPVVPVTVIADQHYLMQALIHLVNNAVQFSDAQQPVVLSWKQEQDLAVIQVRDHGCGIPEAQQERIFDPFYRVDPSRARSTGGVGLGLAIAKALIENMNGTLSVYSVPNQGSTFTITLPTRSVTVPRQLSSSSMP